MKILPSTSQEWFKSFLRPFIFHTPFTFILFQHCSSFSSRTHPAFGSLAEAVAVLYLVSVPVLLFGGLIQLCFKPRSAAVPALLVAVLDVVLLTTFAGYFVKA
jgi:hypothetical protein